MTFVKRANVVLEVADDDTQRFLDMGYDVLDEKGRIVIKAIPTDLGELRRAYVDHENTIKNLQTEVADLKAKLEKSKSVSKKATKVEE